MPDNKTIHVEVITDKGTVAFMASEMITGNSKVWRGVEGDDYNFYVAMPPSVIEQMEQKFSEEFCAKFYADLAFQVVDHL